MFFQRMPDLERKKNRNASSRELIGARMTTRLTSIFDQKLLEDLLDYHQFIGIILYYRFTMRLPAGWDCPIVRGGPTIAATAVLGSFTEERWRPSTSEVGRRGIEE